MASINSSTSLPSTDGGMPRALDTIALVLLIVGGLNWGAIGLFGIDFVAAIFGSMSVVSRIVYVLVGVAALYGFVTLSRLGKAHV